MKEIEYSKYIASLALNFRIKIFKIEEEKYQAEPIDVNNLFSFWLLSKNPPNNKTPNEAVFQLINKYQEFIGFDDQKIEKLAKKEGFNQNDSKVPKFSILPINSKHLHIFEEIKHQIYVKNHPENFKKINDNFSQDLVNLGFERKENSDIFQKEAMPNIELFIPDNQVKIGIAEPKELSNSDYLYLKWFAELSKSQRKQFKVCSIEGIRKIYSSVYKKLS